VSSVFIMTGLFREASSFNQPIGDWDVSNVNYMGTMFSLASSFNQDISSWCVTNITSEPDSFSINSPLIESNKPVWGTCLGLGPITSAIMPPAKNEEDVISIFSDVYTDIAGTDFYPNWGQNTQYNAFDLNGDAILQYTNLNYQGIVIGSEIDASSMETLNIDVWTPDATSIDIYPLPNGVKPADERFVAKDLKPNSWTTINIPMSDFTNQGLPIDKLKAFKFEGSGTVFIDNIYFYKAPSSLGIDDQNQLDISIYPNPTNDKLFIQGLSSSSRVSIYNVLGKLVLSQTISKEINVKQLSKGIYIIKIIDEQKETVRKFIKD